MPAEPVTGAERASGDESGDQNAPGVHKPARTMLRLPANVTKHFAAN
jgi:hypothetical protein